MHLHVQAMFNLDCFLIITVFSPHANCTMPVNTPDPKPVHSLFGVTAAYWYLLAEVVQGTFRSDICTPGLVTQA